MPHRHPRSPRRRRLARLTLVLLALASTTGCRQATQRFAITPSEAKARADDILGAIASRFTNVLRTPRFAAARGRLGKYSLTPSKLEGDTSIWTDSLPGGVRTLTTAGTWTGDRYVFDARADVPLPTRPGDSRHYIRLHPLGDGEYRWQTSVDQAVGRLPAESVADAFGGLMLAAELLGERELRSDYRAYFPRTTAALGRLFSLDTVRSVPHRDGGHLVHVSIGLHPDRLEATMPAFAKYLEKYVSPARYHFVLRERGEHGMPWLLLAADDDRLTFRFRTLNGRLLPMEGPARRMPDAMHVDGEMFAKVMIFEVGASDLDVDVLRIRTPREEAWNFRVQREPEWHLPLASKHLIRAPLRRPFEGGGSTLQIGFRETTPQVTHLSREMYLTVRESAILRWLGALGWTAMSDFAGASEREENRFIAEAFRAMQADARELGLGRRD